MGPVTIPNPVQPIPRLWTNLNRLKTVTEATCDSSWWLLVETALPAVGEALWCIVTPDPKRIIEDYLEPGGGGLGKGIGAARDERWVEGETGRLRKIARTVLEDPSRRVAAHLPGRKYFKGRVAGAAEKWLWGPIDILAEVAWYWLIADVAADFTGHWYSGLVQSRFCQSPAGCIFAASADYPNSNVSALWGTAESLNVTEAKNVEWFTNGRLNRGATSAPQQGIVELQCDVTRTIPSGNNWHMTMTLRVTLASGFIYTQTVRSDDVEGTGTATCKLTTDLGDWRELEISLAFAGAGYSHTAQHSNINLITFDAT